MNLKAETKHTLHVLVAVLAVSFLFSFDFDRGFSFGRSKASGQTPVGYIEKVDENGVLYGWAADPDTSESITVHIYLDGPADRGGTLIRSIKANVPRADVPHAGNHGFALPIPYRDGHEHTVYAYGIDSSNDPLANRPLSGNPITFTLQPSIVSIRNGTIEAGIDTKCGGVLASLKLKGGPNMINNYDCGRQVQAALYDGNEKYDGCAGCDNMWGWNPVQGGDSHNFGSKIIDQKTTDTSIYVKVQPYQWFPDNKSGYAGNPVLGDLFIEQTVSFVEGQDSVVKVSYKITHPSSDSHSHVVQELPAFYVAPEYRNVEYYSGSRPWTFDQLSSTRLLSMPVPPHQAYYSSEKWTALVNSNSDGVGLYYPGYFPYFDGAYFGKGISTGEYSDQSNYIRPHVPMSISADLSRETEVYIVVGSLGRIREAVYDLKKGMQEMDFADPDGFLDYPNDSQVLRGMATVSGWTFDNSGISRVEVYVDDMLVGNALHGAARYDLLSAYPNAPVSSGYSYQLDTRNISDGWHTVKVKSYDTHNHAATFKKKSVLVSNAPDDQVPITQITSPPAGKVLARNSAVRISSSASDNVGIARVEFYVNGGLTCAVSSAPYHCDWRVPNQRRGTYVLLTKAYDVADNVTVSDPVTVKSK